MRKVREQEVRELLVTMEEARTYIQHYLWSQVEASLYRLWNVEDKLRELLGEQSLPHVCYHQCEKHPAIQTVKSDRP
jgi:hypothetical protein